MARIANSAAAAYPGPDTARERTCWVRSWEPDYRARTQNFSTALATDVTPCWASRLD